jgi:hypothetical protein
MQFAGERSAQTNAMSSDANRLNDGSLALAAKIEHATAFAKLPTNTESSFSVLLIA